MQNIVDQLIADPDFAGLSPHEKRLLVAGLVRKQPEWSQVSPDEQPRVLNSILGQWPDAPAAAPAANGPAPGTVGGPGVDIDLRRLPVRKTAPAQPTQPAPPQTDLADFAESLAPGAGFSLRYATGLARAVSSIPRPPSYLASVTTPHDPVTEEFANKYLRGKEADPDPGVTFEAFRKVRAAKVADRPRVAASTGLSAGGQLAILREAFLVAPDGPYGGRHALRDSLDTFNGKLAEAWRVGAPVVQVLKQFGIDRKELPSTTPEEDAAWKAGNYDESGKLYRARAYRHFALTPADLRKMKGTLGELEAKLDQHATAARNVSARIAERQAAEGRNDMAATIGGTAHDAVRGVNMVVTQPVTKAWAWLKGEDPGEWTSYNEQPGTFFPNFVERHQGPGAWNALMRAVGDAPAMAAMVAALRAGHRGASAWAPGGAMGSGAAAQLEADFWRAAGNEAHHQIQHKDYGGAAVTLAINALMYAYEPLYETGKAQVGKRSLARKERLQAEADVRAYEDLRSELRARGWLANQPGAELETPTLQRQTTVLRQAQAVARRMAQTGESPDVAAQVVVRDQRAGTPMKDASADVISGRDRRAASQPAQPDKPGLSIGRGTLLRAPAPETPAPGEVTILGPDGRPYRVTVPGAKPAAEAPPTTAVETAPPPGAFDAPPASSQLAQPAARTGEGSPAATATATVTPPATAPVGRIPLETDLFGQDLKSVAAMEKAAGDYNTLFPGANARVEKVGRRNVLMIDADFETKGKNAPRDAESTPRTAPASVRPSAPTMPESGSRPVDETAGSTSGGTRTAAAEDPFAGGGEGGQGETWVGRYGEPNERLIHETLPLETHSRAHADARRQMDEAFRQTRQVHQELNRAAWSLDPRPDMEDLMTPGEAKTFIRRVTGQKVASASQAWRVVKAFNDALYESTNAEVQRMIRELREQPDTHPSWKEPSAPKDIPGNHIPTAHIPEGNTATGSPAEPAANPKSPRQKAMARVWAVLNEKGLGKMDRAARLKAAGEKVGREITSFRDLSDAELHDLAAHVEKGGKLESRKADRRDTHVPGAKGVAFTPDNNRVEFHYAVVEADDLVASHTSMMAENPAYDQALQPRDRTRRASAEQVAEIARKLTPERLADSADTTNGAPIIGPDNQVESGNGRTLGIVRAYEREPESAARYRQWLDENAERLGIDRAKAAGMKKPVLVRVRDTYRGKADLTPAERAAFAEEAGKSTVAAMSAEETAAADGRRVRTSGLLQWFRPNEDGVVTTAANQQFVDQFIRSLPPAERPAMRQANGELSAEGARRIQNAVTAAAYDEPAALRRLLGDPDPEAKNVGRAMVQAAARLAMVKQKMAEGELPSELDLTGDIAQAAARYAHLREKNAHIPDYLAQENLFGNDPVETELIRWFHENKRSAPSVRELFESYADIVEKLGKLFDSDVPDKLSTLERAKAIAESRLGKDTQTGDLFGETEPGPGAPGGSGGPANDAGGTRPPGGDSGAADLFGEPAPQPTHPNTRTPESLTERLDAAIKEQSKKLRDDLGRMSSGVDPTVLARAAYVGALHIARGVVRFSEWSQAMVRELGEEVRPHLVAVWDMAHDMARRPGAMREAAAQFAVAEESLASTPTGNTSGGGTSPIGLHDRILAGARNRTSRTQPSFFDGEPQDTSSLPPKAVSIARSVGSTAADLLFRSSRAVKSAFDASAPLRQGIILSVNHPRAVPRALGMMFKSFASEKTYRELMDSMGTAQGKRFADEMGLYLQHRATERSSSDFAGEEAYQSSLAESVPLLGRAIRASERGYGAYLDALRMDGWRAGVEELLSHKLTPQRDMKAYTDLAELINRESGRANLGAFEEAANVLNHVFYSVRFQASRISLMNPAYYARLHPAVRKMAVADMVRYVTAVGAVVGVARALGADVELDPRSSNFGQIRLGKTRIDLWAGFRPYAVALSRIATGQKKGAVDNQLRPLRGRDLFEQAGGELWHQARFKLSPAVGTAVTLATGKNAVGEKQTPAQAAGEMVTPMFLKDLYEAMEDRGALEGAVVSLPGFFGAGSSTFAAPPP